MLPPRRPFDPVGGLSPQGLGGRPHGVLRRPDRYHGSGDRTDIGRPPRRGRVRRYPHHVPERQRRMRRAIEGGRGGGVVDRELRRVALLRRDDYRGREYSGSHARGEGDVHELRPALGQRFQRPLPIVQVVGARGGHRHSLRGALAQRHQYLKGRRTQRRWWRRFPRWCAAGGGGENTSLPLDRHGHCRHDIRRVRGRVPLSIGRQRARAPGGGELRVRLWRSRGRSRGRRRRRRRRPRH
mmetsp:Transcript_20564/g.59660  ORF Transcript_20564/g.59660 Transcript_20564/m.59660 type:complete len:240 (+) Transcript_20564:594-1313(+)